MKYLLLLFLALPAEAAIRLDIDSKRMGAKYWLTFETQEKADEYKREKFNDHHWGQNEREVDKAYASEEELKASLKERQEEIDTFEPDENGEIKPVKKTITWITLPAEYTITQTDITAEVDAKKAKEKEIADILKKNTATTAELLKVLKAKFGE